MTAPHMTRGDLVRTWFDTGALGVTHLYGTVVKAGPTTYTVEWESGIRNRTVQGYRGIERLTGADAANARIILRTQQEPRS